MQMESLKLYCDVVRLRSFSKCAAENGVTQSTASQTVAGLEARLGVTLELTLTALVFASVGGMVLGVAAARMRGRWPDTAIQTASSAGYSIPDFWLGQLLILTFAIGLGWLPSQGNSSVRDATDGFAGWLDHMRYLILPAFALSLRYLALITRITRSSMLEVMGSDYILAARSRGASEWTVVVVHGLRNAAAPVLTVIGYNVGFILAGSALIEAVFAWPGIGRLLFESISRRDYPVMLAILLMVSTTVVLANLVTDIVHRLIDPRIERT